MLLSAAILLGIQSLKPYEISPGFFVSLPKKPVVTSEKGNSKQKYWQVVLPDGVYVIASFPVRDKEPKPADQTLAAMEAGLLVGSEGKLVSHRDILLNGWPGIELKIKSEEGLTTLNRSFVAGDYGYQINAIYGDPTRGIPGMQKLFDSIRIPGKGPLTEPGAVFKPFSFSGDQVSFGLPSKPEESEQPIKNNRYGRTMHRAVAVYGNRLYIVGYAETPEAAKEKISAENAPEVLKYINEDVASSLKAKSMKSAPITRNGIVRMGTQFASQGESEMLGRVESFATEGRIYLMLVLYPRALTGTTELKRFFESARIAPNAGG